MRNYLLAVFLPLAAALFLAVGFSGHAKAFDPFKQDPIACQQTDSSGNTSTVCDTNGANDPLTGSDGVITKIANIFAFITGVAAIVIIMVSGFEYVRSGGDSAKINKAKNGILFAVIGLVVVAVARSVVLLAVNKL